MDTLMNFDQIVERLEDPNAQLDPTQLVTVLNTLLEAARTGAAEGDPAAEMVVPDIELMIDLINGEKQGRGGLW